MSDHMGQEKAFNCEQFEKTYLAVISNVESVSLVFRRKGMERIDKKK